MKIAYLDILYDGNDAFEELASELNRHARIILNIWHSKILSCIL